jgi:ligand-binding sensor domain-containing protein
MRMKLCILLAFLLFSTGFSNTLVAQLPHELPDFQSNKDLYFKHITRENGLPSNRIRCITQDFLGYLWVGTSNGLVRYDGSRMKVFQYIPGKDSSIIESTVTALFESSDSLLWIGYMGSFSVYNSFTGKFEHHKKTDDLPNSYPGGAVRSFWEDQDKTIWVATSNGLINYNRKNRSFEHFLDSKTTDLKRMDNFRFIYNIVEDPRDSSKLLLATVGGLIQFDKKKHIVTADYEKNCEHHYPSQSIYNEGDTVLWTGEWATGLKRFSLKDESWEVYYFEKDYLGSVLSILPKNNHELWIGTADKGLGVFNKKNKTFKFNEYDKSKPKSISSNHLLCNIFIDKNSNLWIGTLEGLNLLDRQYQSFKKVEIPFDIDNVRTFYRDAMQKKVYFGIKGKFNVVVWDEKKSEWYPIKHDISEVKERVATTQIYKDKSGKIWVGTALNSLLYLDSFSNTLKLFRAKDGKPLKLNEKYPATNYLLEDKEGNLWTSSIVDGLVRINKDRTEAEYFNFEASNANSLREGTHHYNLELDKKGRIWISSYNGFDVFDFKNKKFVHSIGDSLNKIGIKNNNTFDFECDSLGRMWFGMVDEGLVRFTEKEDGSYDYKIFHSQHGLNDLNIARMATDPEGNIWIINEGLIKFNPYTESVEVYDKRNGLWQNKNFDDRIYIDFEGNIFLTSSNAYETKNINEIKTKPGIVNLIVDEIDINGSKRINSLFFNNNANITFEAGENNLNFSYSAICFWDIDQVLYKYKLVGNQDLWSVPTKNTEVRYTNLAPGKYEFIVMVSHRGVWLDKAASVKFSIKPYFWQTAWFKMLVVAIILGIIYFIYRLKIRRIRKEEKLKSDFKKKIAEVEMQALRAQMNPHFIFNSLNSINNFILKNESEQASEFLTKFSRLVRQVLQNSRNKLVSLEDEFSALKLYIELEQVRFDNKFQFEIICDKYLDTNLVLIPPLLIQPLC